MMWQSIVVERLPTTEILALENLATNFGRFFHKINLQGRNKLIVLSMSAREFTEVPHIIGCKIPQGIVC